MIPADPLTLTDDAFVAQGAGRMVFTHPDRPDVIVKVPKIRPAKRSFLGTPRLYDRARAFGPMWNSFVEIREFSRSVSAVGRVSPQYAQFLGFVQTDRGPGAMFQAVRGASGALATTLHDHAKRHGHEPEMELAIKALWAEIKDVWLIVSDRGLPNVAVTGDASTGYALVIVDGIGDRAHIPLQMWFRSIHMKKTERQMAKVLIDYRTLTGVHAPDTD